MSWHEAAAYCESEGKALPTVHHWRRAATVANFATILEVSNFAGRGPAPVGRYGGLGPFGTYDTAGNVREWCSNASGEKRYILGGAWSDPKYLFHLPDARLPFDRSMGNGFRCVKYEHPPAAELSRPVDPSGSPSVASSRRPAMKSSRSIGRFTPTIGASWKPRSRRPTDPPFQTVVIFPGNYAFDIPSSARLESQWFDFIVRSGRAVMHPIYKGTYERTIGNWATWLSQPSVFREVAIQWHKDLGRSIDYLETRPEFDRERIAFHGISGGAAQGPRLMALEPRLKVGVLMWGGFGPWAPAEVHAVNYASRSKAPTLMVNGRSDPIFPFETSQIPMFRLLGTPDKDKRHFVVEGGHPAFSQEVVREVVGWLDRYLGPVSAR